jgi:hypothetical protein
MSQIIGNQDLVHHSNCRCLQRFHAIVFDGERDVISRTALNRPMNDDIPSLVATRIDSPHSPFLAVTFENGT